MHRIGALALCATIAACCVARADANDSPRADDEKAIRTAASQYLAALARGDAQAALGFWTPDGDIVDEYGRRSSAKERIEQDIASGGAQDSAELPQTTLRFLGPQAALEDGAYEGADGSRGRFTAVWSKVDGLWRLASLREACSPTSAIADVTELSWLVGHWIGESDGTTFDISTRWNDEETFLVRTLTATHNGTQLLKAQQRIGIDPADGRLKCWTHDAGGGHSEGTWSRRGTSWVVESRGVASDGQDLRGVSVYSPEGDDQIRWSSFDNWRGGQPMLDFDVTLTRAQENK